MIAGFAVIDKKAPEFTITPAVPITAENLEEAWSITQKMELPKVVKGSAGCKIIPYI